MLSDPVKRAALVLAALFVAAIVAGFTALAVYTSLAGSVPPLQLLGGAFAVLGLLLLGVEALRRR